MSYTRPTAIGYLGVCMAASAAVITMLYLILVWIMNRTTDR